MQNIKNLFTLSILLLIIQTTIAQTILLEQDFSTATGTTPPTAWTVQTTVGEAGVDVWHFDNPRNRTVNSPIVSNFAIFDSDNYSNNSLAEEVYLTSPVFDATTTDDIYLELDHMWNHGIARPVLTQVVDVFKNAPVDCDENGENCKGIRLQ